DPILLARGSAPPGLVSALRVLRRRTTSGSACVGSGGGRPRGLTRVLCPAACVLGCLGTLPLHICHLPGRVLELLRGFGTTGCQFLGGLCRSQGVFRLS